MVDNFAAVGCVLLISYAEPNFRSICATVSFITENRLRRNMTSVVRVLISLARYGLTQGSEKPQSADVGLPEDWLPRVVCIYPMYCYASPYTAIHRHVLL